MKRLTAGLIFLMMLLSCCVAETQLIELGIPTEKQFNEKKLHSRNVWDMALKDGVLYIGSGDYSENTGPARIWGYSLETGEWSRTGILSDEAIIRYVELGDELLIPGTDPTTDWSIGFYHRLDNGKWKSQRIPLAVHMFDIADYDGLRFVGIGTANDIDTPAKVSSDGEKFEKVSFLDKEGKDVFGTNKYSYTRVYDFMLLDNQLYCLAIGFSDEGASVFNGIFRYEDEAFHLWSRPAFTAQRGSRQNRLYAKEEMNGRLYIAFNKLYRTSDLKEIETLSLPDEGIVQDLYLEKTGRDAGLYVLGSRKKSADNWMTTIWRYTDENGFEEVYTFSFTTSAMSFVKHGEDFYVGMGRYIPNDQVSDPGMGMVFHVDR